MTNQTTNIVATSAVFTPWWLPMLQNWSELAGLLLPIAGLLWLIIQIAGYVTKYNKAR